ncbi:uncharacterized protein TNCV_4866741 [Trichonephila clavipes]|nr:uncharacterized protein TNCV_4866741 [Trichonephila clavipes]
MLPKELHHLKYEAISVPQGSVRLDQKDTRKKKFNLLFVDHQRCHEFEPSTTKDPSYSFSKCLYVALPSDSSMHFFPENKISRFKTQLPSPVYLNGELEVGLSEIIYPHSWLNVNEANNYFLYKVGDGDISSTVKRTIDVGCYETMLDIISAVQRALPKNPNRFTINYNKATKRVKINSVQGSSLHLENLGELLGFKHNAIIIGNMKSEFVADA